MLFNLLNLKQEVSKDAYLQVDDTPLVPVMNSSSGAFLQPPGLIMNPRLGAVDNAVAETDAEKVKQTKKAGRGELILDEEEQDVDMPYVSCLL